MGKYERRKGYRAENELVNLLKDNGIEAKRIPLSGATEYQKGDIELPDKGIGEVKIRKRIANLLYEMVKEDGIGFIREDYNDWLVVMTLDEWMYLFKKYMQVMEEE